MNLVLSPELQVFVNEQLQSGQYDSEADLYIKALQSFADREKYLQAKRDELREVVRVGTEQADRGETIDGELAMSGFREKLEPDPWLNNIGIFQDDPTFDDFLSEMKTYRSEVDATEVHP
jgi:antitoxin ParD1/3/4